MTDHVGERPLHDLKIPDGFILASVWARLVGYLLEVLIGLFTLGVGYIIWSLIVWGQGTTPGKQLLGMSVLEKRTGDPASWARMLGREVGGKTLVTPLLSMFTCGIGGVVIPFILLVTKDRQQHWDMVADTIVVQKESEQEILSNPVIVTLIVLGGSGALFVMGGLVLAAVSS